METALTYQPELFGEAQDEDRAHARFKGRSGAFVDNMALPVHRWYRYSAGFSADWVRSVVREHSTGRRNFAVLDPFAGVGTTLLACSSEKVRSWGFETHPFVHRVAVAKLCGIHSELAVVRGTFTKFLRCLPNVPDNLPPDVPDLLAKCYTGESLAALFSMRKVFQEEFDLKTPETELLWLVVTSILRACSKAGTAQWQYVLPNKRKTGVLRPIDAYQAKASSVLQDIEHAQRNGWSSLSQVFLTDARAPKCPSAVEVDSVITSPPYPNNYDYADATRLEMTFWGEIRRWGDLQEAVRRHLIRSCSQHASAEKLVLEDMLSEPVLEPIKSALSDACYLLEEIRETKGGRKNYHTMASAYFRDLGYSFNALRRICRPGGFMCFVIGDSAPYGVYLSVDEWLGNLAVAAGFKSFSFEKIRDRNVKWKNRKHRVPLKEGRLWIQG